MSALSIVIFIFSVIGAIDYLIGNKLGLGNEFKRGFDLLGTMALTMIGMIVLAPAIGAALSPVFDFIHRTLGLDPSIIPASLLANDMGGAPLATEAAKDTVVGGFNAYVVSAMMGSTVSYTIPLALGVVKKDRHRQLILGLLCGIVTIPVGCFVSGLICGINVLVLLYNILPLVLFSGLIAAGLLLFPNVCVKIFSVLGFIIKALIVVGLVLGILNFLAGKTIVSGLGTLEEGAMICVNATITMTGMFPLIGLVSRLLSKPLGAVGKKLGINERSTVGILATLATSTTTFGMADDMDDKGLMVNSAFAVSAAFVFAGHLAFTMAYDQSYIAPMIVGKLISGALALVLALLLYKRFSGIQSKSERKKEGGEA